MLDAAGRGAPPDSIELRGGTERGLTIADLAADELGVQFTDCGRPSKVELAELLDLVSRGEVSVPVAKVLPFTEAARAQALVDSGHTGGKACWRPDGWLRRRKTGRHSWARPVKFSLSRTTTPVSMVSDRKGDDREGGPA
ncbi:zinc-binding dehydrogenase [Myceligenerans salitolerans]|uniref:zinc-binding dehydrogenase n=1 Tax=Myceligenerans salitolerans TaxID=1230528 RepID=UPI0027DBBE2A|nr:zinc-binding dehydrogenase [Myceligenerans salitolerans]